MVLWRNVLNTLHGQCRGVRECPLSLEMCSICNIRIFVAELEVVCQAVLSSKCDFTMHAYSSTCVPSHSHMFGACQGMCLMAFHSFSLNQLSTTCR